MKTTGMRRRQRDCTTLCCLVLFKNMGKTLLRKIFPTHVLISFFLRVCLMTDYGSHQGFQQNARYNISYHLCVKPQTMPLSKDRESFGSLYDSYAPAVFGE